MLLATQNKPAETREQLSSEALKCSRADPDISYWTASAYALLGDKEAALEWLERTIDLGFENRELFENDPTLASLYHEDGFKGLMERIATLP